MFFYDVPCSMDRCLLVVSRRSRLRLRADGPDMVPEHVPTLRCPDAAVKPTKTCDMLRDWYINASGSGEHH